MLVGYAVISGEASDRDVEAESPRCERRFAGSEMNRRASAVGARKLVLFCLSDRDTSSDWRGRLAELRDNFLATVHPSQWGLEGRRDGARRAEPSWPDHRDARCERASMTGVGGCYVVHADSGAALESMSMAKATWRSPASVSLSRS